MKFHSTVEEIAKALHGVASVQDPVQVTGVSTDTRKIAPGDLFFCLRGGSFDGHQFVEQAVLAGASAVVVDTDPIGKNEGLFVPFIRVLDTKRAYQQLATWWRCGFGVKVVGITGSVGKTTTKEIVASVLSELQSGAVLKTKANFNNEIGVPQTLLELDQSHSYAVIEMGMRGLGEIAELATIALPDVGMITNCGTAHIGRLGSRAAIAQAKCELLSHLSVERGVAVLNGESEALMEQAPTDWQPFSDPERTLIYGLTCGNFQGCIVGEQEIEVQGLRFSVPLPGRHNALNFLGALAVAHAFKLPWRDLSGKQIKLDMPEGRSKRYILPNDIILLDETYNAGPESMKAAIQLLSSMPTHGRRAAVLGRMGELGAAFSSQLHMEVGGLVKSEKLDRLFVLQGNPEGCEDESGVRFGEDTYALITGASPIPTHVATSIHELVNALNKWLQPGDRVLFKASHSVGLNAAVSSLVTIHSDLHVS